MYRALATSLGPFEALVGGATRARPLEIQLPFSVFEQARNDPARYPQGVRLLAVSDETTGDVGVALQTPPYKPLLSATTPQVAADLGRCWAASHPDDATLLQAWLDAFIAEALPSDTRRTRRQTTLVEWGAGTPWARSTRLRNAAAAATPPAWSSR